MGERNVYLHMATNPLAPTLPMQFTERQQDFASLGREGSHRSEMSEWLEMSLTSNQKNLDSLDPSIEPATCGENQLEMRTGAS